MMRVLMMLAVVVMALCCGAVSFAEPIADERIATNKLGEQVTVRDIGDPANPYVGKYSAIDRWMWEHYAATLPPEVEALYAKPHNEAEWAAFRARQPEGWAVQFAEVDSEGWLIPYELTRAKGRYRVAPHTLRQEVTGDYDRSELQQRIDKRFQFRALGIFGPDMRQQQEELVYRTLAQDIPHIPAWLGTRPPLLTVLSPNGDFIVHGPLNLHLADDPSRVVIHSGGASAGEDWYRYAADGRRLGTYTDPGDGPHGFRWQDIYADMSLVEQSFKDRGIDYATHYTSGGYRVYIAKDGGNEAEILAAYDYAGRPVDPDTTLVDHGNYFGTQLPQSVIEGWYQGLVKSGTVDSNEKSPWEGTPQGPVAVDPTPRPPKLMAQRSHVVGVTKRGVSMAGSDYIAVKALDDPANPYREQYQPWDHWVFSQVNKRNPKEVEWQKQQQQVQRIFSEGNHGSKIQTSEQTGYTPPAMYTPPFDDPWRTFILKVDDNGFVVPFMHGRAESWTKRTQPAKWDSMYLKDPQPNHYQIQAGGVMPGEVKAALLAELRRETPQRFPPVVPAWMEAAPPYMFHLMPNGEYVTSGPVGSWSEDWERVETQAGLDRKDRYLRHGWYRYSAHGEQLGSVHSESWTELYNPRYKALRDEGLAAGYTAWEMGGFLAWYTKASGTGIDDDMGGDIVRKWDYLGNEVPADTTYYRPDGALRQWRWEEVVRAQRGELPDWI